MRQAIIVGASSGIGREVARLLLDDGWQIGIMARREEVLLELKAEKPSKVEVEVCDITQETAPERLLSLIGRMGGVDLYFHASGVGKQNVALNPIVEDGTVNTNVLGFTRMVDAAFNYMAVNQGGHIAVISSIAGTKGLGPAPSYSATKAFQNTYIQALEQLANKRRLKIHFTDIRPGFVATPLIEGSDYPMVLDKTRTARAIVRAVYAKKHICIIDWRYRLVVFLWRLIPNALWRRLNLAK